MIYDEHFLAELDKQKHHTSHVRITSLTFDERPIETIEGRVTAGSANIDGASAVRRTCQLTMVTDQANISDYNWSMNTKFKLEIGLENYINSSYPDIIWFQQGIFVINSFSAALGTNNYTINISGKDKMCMLNGEVGGNLNSQVDFGNFEQVDKDGNIKIISQPVKTIIRDIVHQYGNEPFHNIIINDIDNAGLFLMEYAYDTPMYLLRKAGTSEYINATVNGVQEGQVKNENDEFVKVKIEELPQYDSLFSINGISVSSTIFYQENIPYNVAKIEYGQTAGYQETELTYPGDLIANAGESITSVLDKIKNFLGEFEYFYDLDGRFIFQKKRTWVDTPWNPISTDSESGVSYVDALRASSPCAYIFKDSELFTAFNNTPAISNVKNDYTVWGTRKGVGGADIPIHMRYAIDNKPFMYKSIQVADNELNEYNEKYGLAVKGQNSVLYITDEQYAPETPQVFSRFRRLSATRSNQFYYDEDNQILILYTTGNENENGILSLDNTSGTLEANNVLRMQISSYVLCDWRELIYRMAKDYSKYNHLDDFEQRVAAANPELFPTGKTGYEQYYIDLDGFWRQLYTAPGTDEGLEDIEYNEFGWNTQVQNAPESLNFWFDFLDMNGDISKYSVSNIGSRPKVVNDSAVKAIYYRDTPNIIFMTKDPDIYNTGYRYFKMGIYSNMFRKSAQGKSAKDALDTLLYNHSYAVESASITSIPIYHLEPNIRVYIEDVETGVEGEYILTKYSLPLTYNGMMNITATKAAERIL